jgi:predicted GNAT superfamily acetyltransferase
MEVHSHTHTPLKKWTHYLWEFFMMFLAVFAGFLAENQREHIVEKKRAHQFLQSMRVDIQSNIRALESLLAQDSELIIGHGALVTWLLADSLSIDRAAFAKTLGAVWIRNFLMRKETYEQMKSSGSLRYVGNIEFLKSMMDYDRITNFAQYRSQEFEKKYYTDLFIPTLYKCYDLTCQINLDTSNHSNPFLMEKLAQHQDVLTGNEAAIFRHDMGAALMLRLERLRRSRDAFIDARSACIKMEQLINNKLGDTVSY